MNEGLFEDHKSKNDHDDDDHVTPEPGSMLLLGTGLVVMGGLLGRQLGKKSRS